MDDVSVMMIEQIIVIMEFLFKSILATLEEKQKTLSKTEDCFNINYLFKVYPTVD